MIGIQKYYLGCPVWSDKRWPGEFFPLDIKPSDHLRQYASVFNSVEGNTTFYGIPKKETLVRWRSSVSESFRFCFKFPRVVTHERGLRHGRAEALAFLNALEPVRDVLGVVFLQLPPRFGGAALDELESFIPILPAEFSYGVEVRHADYFFNEPIERRFNELLQMHDINRVLFDTQTLHSIKSSDPSILHAQNRKPRLRERLLATGKHPFVRFVGHNNVGHNQARFKVLSAQIAEWIEQGLEPFVFIHAPDEFYAPRLCGHFHAQLSHVSDVGTIPTWPIDNESTSQGQLSLFD